jgi:hypothetical protein
MDIGGLTVSKTNLPCGANAAAPVATEVHCEPADNHRHRAVASGCDQEERSILDVRVVLAVYVE